MSGINAFGRNDNSADYHNGAFQHFIRHLDLGYPSCCSYAEGYRDQLVPSELSRGKVRFSNSITPLLLIKWC